MRPVPRRLLPLVLTCLATGGCARILPPSSYASLVEPPAAETLSEPAVAAGIVPEDDGIEDSSGAAAPPGTTDPVDALARSRDRTARWMADPASRRSMAATLPTGGARHRPARTRTQDPQAAQADGERSW